MNNKPVIVLLHGAGVDHHWWHPQSEALRQEFRVLAPDLPGHGKRAGEAFRMRAAVDNLFETIDQAGAAPAVLVGISLGGYLAAVFAKMHPEHTAGLVLSGSSMNLAGAAGIGFKLTGLFLRLKGESWLEGKTLESYRKRIPAEILETAIPGGLHMRSAMSAFGEAAGRNYHRMLAGLEIPVLILNGEGDEQNTGSQEALLSRLRRGSLQTLRDSGHLANLEQPEAFTAAVRAFALELSGKRTEH